MEQLNTGIAGSSSLYSQQPNDSYTSSNPFSQLFPNRISGNLKKKLINPVLVDPKIMQILQETVDTEKQYMSQQQQQQQRQQVPQQYEQDKINEQGQQYNSDFFQYQEDPNAIVSIRSFDVTSYVIHRGVFFVDCFVNTCIYNGESNRVLFLVGNNVLSSILNLNQTWMTPVQKIFAFLCVNRPG